MNFSEDFEWYRDSELWFIQTIIVWILVLIFTVFLFVLVSSDVPEEKVLMPNWLFFLTIPISCVLSNFLNYAAHITDETNKTYSRFNYKEFKKWYGFRPERFIFEQASYLYFIVEPEKYNQSGKVHLTNEDINSGLVLCLMPRTFIDYCLYGIFIGIEYRKFKRENEVCKNTENNKERARNMFILLNSLQSEVNKELKESNQIIEEEISKMRGVIK